jgi:hypothetical protein
LFHSEVGGEEVLVDSCDRSFNFGLTYDRQPLVWRDFERIPPVQVDDFAVLGELTRARIREVLEEISGGVEIATDIALEPTKGRSREEGLELVVGCEDWVVGVDRSPDWKDGEGKREFVDSSCNAGTEDDLLLLLLLSFSRRLLVLQIFLEIDVSRNKSSNETFSSIPDQTERFSESRSFDAGWNDDVRRRGASDVV